MTVAEGPQPPDREAEEALEHVRARSDRAVEVAVVLGSGLGDAVAADLESGDEFAWRPARVPSALHTGARRAPGSRFPYTGARWPCSGAGSTSTRGTAWRPPR